MAKTINETTISELLAVQKEFDKRITTKNISDTTLAYFVELFEWLNTLETFKNWKASPGKPRETQLDELADVLAFSLSLLGQVEDEFDGDSEVVQGVLGGVVHCVTELKDVVKLDNSTQTLGYFHLLLEQLFDAKHPGIGVGTVANYIAQPFILAEVYYSTDELISAYKAKMAVNHARQDGTADEDKGYV